jgi:GNAT superfamily N-acetyltransferase
LWWHSRHIKVASFKIVAVLEAYRGRGLDALLYYEIGRAALTKGYQWMDASIISEYNPTMSRIVERLGGKRYKLYRVYQLAL